MSVFVEWKMQNIQIDTQCHYIVFIDIKCTEGYQIKEYAYMTQ